MTKIMGILNVTPDSFSDGGRYTALEQAVAHDHRADGRVARRHALGRGDHVRDDAEAGHREHLADAAEGADRLVGDEQHVVLVADLAHALEVSGRRREAAAGVLNGL